MSTEETKSNLDKTSSKKKKTSLNKILKITVLILLLIVFIGAGIALGIAYSWISSAPPLDTEEVFNLNQTTYIVDEEGNVIDKLHANENRSIVSLDKIPKHLQNAFIAIEDKRFYKHNGIDIQRIIGSAIEDIKQRKLAHGGSTITQQLIKNVYLTRDKLWKRKVIEMYYAIQLERQFTKDQILEAYLNTIGLGGNNIAGVQEAALYYFGKDVSNLTLAESAVIAGITNLPSAYSPYLNYERSMQRKNLILSEMLKQNMISRAEYDEAIAQEIKLAKIEKEVETTYFADMVIKDVISAFQEKLGYSKEEAERKVFNGGLKIVSTIDTKIQNIMEDTFNNAQLFPKSTEDENGTLQPEAAMVIIDNNTGHIKAVMGGRSSKVRRGLNRATQSPRQPGSSIKPLAVYTPALDNGYTAATVIDDSPVTFGNYSPNNYSRNFNGLVTVREAIQSSLNVVAVKIVQDIGVQRSVEYLEKFGISTIVKTGSKTDLNLPALALGGMTKGIKPVELAAAYTVFPNKGVYTKPVSFTKVLDRHGNVILDNTPEKHRVISEQVAYMMVDIMKGVIKGGTGGNAALSNMPVAGKTGTTSDMKDAWFAGYTPYYTAVVWMGHDEPKAMNFTGGSYPAKLWKAVMQEVHKDLKRKEFEKPDGLVAVNICTESGKRPSELCALDPRGATIRSELFIKGTEPPVDSICDIHVIKDICTISNKLASEYCPIESVQSKVFTQRHEPLDPNRKMPADAIYEAPTAVCDIHKNYVPDINEHIDDNIIDDGTVNEDIDNIEFNGSSNSITE
ncbi:transglycosylase domain-containing protein [Lutispora thermophila]|uniref:Penicillin-binding protein 1A n=1 Tax=Lutispora thermophila DSM 19022 TaxID=1122184 RepID=A0A1M6GR52_9FIRM|nr:PBP1A family penicillin-binding protein [Lutispora thermophila]SHJ12378.1 penicillin-binding protein 1A [Lutispora thermophila DSM 19022]